MKQGSQQLHWRTVALHAGVHSVRAATRSLLPAVLLTPGLLSRGFLTPPRAQTDVSVRS